MESNNRQIYVADRQIQCNHCDSDNDNVNDWQWQQQNKFTRVVVYVYGAKINRLIDYIIISLGP